MLIKELSSYGIPDSIIDIWEKEEGQNLLPVQEQAVLKYGLFKGGNLLVSAPTSSGKTFVGEMAACHEALRGGRVIYLAPLKAIAEEKFEDFRAKYAAYGIRVIISTGNHREYDADLRDGDYQLAVVVFDKLLYLSVSNPQILDSATLVVVDECQMISDSSRGSRLEILLTKIRGATYPPRLLCLSAVAEEAGALDKWLDAGFLHTRVRPIELREGVLGASGEFRFREWNSGKTSKEILCNEAVDADALLAEICRSLIERKEQVIVFLSTPELTYQTTEGLVNAGVNGGRAKSAIGNLSELEPTEVTERLQKSFPVGLAFHNGDMELDERLLVERYFKQGEIRVLCATSTLAMGVNLPAKNVIMVDPRIWVLQQGQWAQREISVGDYRNMGGRAGRLQTGDQFGRSILLGATTFHRDHYWGSFIQGRVERLVSRLGESELIDLCLNLIASGVCDTKDSISSFIVGSFWAFTKTAEELAKQELAARIEEAVKSLITTGLLKSSTGKLRIMPLGNICAAKGLPVDDFSYLVKWLQACSAKAPIDLFEVLLAASLTTAVRTSRFPLPGGEAYQWAEQVRGRCSEETNTTSMNFVLGITRSSYDLGRGCKIALVTEKWVHGDAVREIEREFGVRGGVTRNIAGTVSWVVDTLSAIAAELGFTEKAIQNLNDLDQSLIYGLPRSCTALACLRVNGVHRGILMQLHHKKQIEPDAILELNPSELPIPRQVAIRLQEAILKHYGENLRREMTHQVQRLRRLGVDEQIIKAVYAAKDKDFELRIADLFSQGLSGFSYERIARQREGEPDGVLHTPDGGNLVVSITASDKKISMKKSQEILGSAGAYPPLKGAIVIGKPDFHELAISRAAGIATSVCSYKLIPVYVLAEMWVRLKEGKLTQQNINAILASEVGYVTKDMLDKFTAP